MKRVFPHIAFLLTAFSLAGCGELPGNPAEPAVVAAIPEPVYHPVFNTLVTGESATRPAIQVDILDASESWFTTAELYLAVESSRFPSNTWVLLPINVGDFEGCRVRFVQLPFELQPGDNLVFNLLDDDELTEEDERLIAIASKMTSYCVLSGACVYAPTLSQIVNPIADAGLEMLGDVIVDSITMQKFDYYGKAEYITAQQLPEQPNQANRLTLLDDANYARIQLRIYGPTTPLDLAGKQ